MTAPAADRAAILAILAAEDAAWAAGDAEAFAASAAPEIVFTNIRGVFSVGRAPFVGQHRHAFASFFKGSTLRQEIVHIAFVRPDVAIVDTLTTLTGFGDLPPEIVATDGRLNTRLEQVMVADNGVWSVAAFHNVSVDPRTLAGPSA